MQDEHDQTAKGLRRILEASGRYGPIDALDPHDGSIQAHIEEILAAALRSVKAPPGCVIDTDGECNQVLGTLLLTRDKCIIGMGATVWVHMFGGDGPTCEAGVLEIIDNDDQHPDDYPEGGRYMLKLRNGDGREDVVPFGKVFGTREAALRAQADAPTKEAHGAD